ncbi:hypothetical protein R1flu_011405 [Riccia fluitans]|uniref:Uncharacterized protein n=1 Tax=Riccia fluitans TaxID=41844 RepID=A0ABD1Z8T7_9MARC
MKPMQINRTLVSLHSIHSIDKCYLAGNDSPSEKQADEDLHFVANAWNPFSRRFEVYAQLEAATERTLPDDEASFTRSLAKQISLVSRILVRQSRDFWLRCTDISITEIHLISRGLDGEGTDDLSLPTGLAVLNLSNYSFHGNLPGVRGRTIYKAG